jgi:hypothetical protein
MNTMCAWCLEEQGEEPQDGDSHGICVPHAEQILMAAQWRKLQGSLSYVEQEAAEFAQKGKRDDH